MCSITTYAITAYHHPMPSVPITTITLWIRITAHYIYISFRKHL